MTNRYGLFFIAALLLLIAGCAGVTTKPSGESAAPAAAELPPPVMSDNRAVIALLDLARTDNEAGRREAAGASLERALRIEPRNPWLWHQLAQLRLTQGQYEQAISLARKSNSFAGHQSRVQSENWQVIGNARIAQGDAAGAKQAFKRAADLAEQAKSEADHNSGFNVQ